MKPHEIERRQAQPQHAEIVIQLEPELFWFRGHFAIQPLLPGVAQLDWAMHYATTLLAPEHRFHSIQSVKFRWHPCCRTTSSRWCSTGTKTNSNWPSAIIAMRVKHATSVAAGRFAYVVNIYPLCGDPLL